MNMISGPGRTQEGRGGGEDHGQGLVSGKALLAPKPGPGLEAQQEVQGLYSTGICACRW